MSVRLSAAAIFTMTIFSIAPAGVREKAAPHEGGGCYVQLAELVAHLLETTNIERNRRAGASQSVPSVTTHPRRSPREQAPGGASQPHAGTGPPVELATEGRYWYFHRQSVVDDLVCLE